MNYLLYLYYGENKKYEHEIRYSILTLIKYYNEEINRDYKIAVYTTKTGIFDDLPIEVFFINKNRLNEWQKDNKYYNHLIKMRALKDLLDKTEITCFVDGDTVFRRSPNYIFNKVLRNNIVLHVKEGPISKIMSKDVIRQLTKISDGEFKLNKKSVMYNSGIIGINRDNSHYLDVAIDLMNKIYNYARLHTADQFALGLVFRKFSRVLTCKNYVYHYWHEVPRTFHHKKMATFFLENNNLESQLCNYDKYKYYDYCFNKYLIFFSNLVCKIFRFDPLFRDIYFSLAESEKSILRNEYTEAETWREFTYNWLILVKDRFQNGVYRKEKRKYLCNRKMQLVRNNLYLRRYSVDEQNKWKMFWSELEKYI